MGKWDKRTVPLSHGYNRYKYAVLYLAVIVLVLVVQVFQSVGSKLALRLDKRIKR